MADQTGSESVTRLLTEGSISDDERARLLLPAVYAQLRAQAQRHMAAERPDHTLDATALVHEAYLKLVGDRELPWQNRGHFYAAAAEAMRRVLIDHARHRGRKKRGADHGRVPLSVADVAEHWDERGILNLDDAIRRLSEQNQAVGETVRLRLFAGLSIQQTADAMGVSPATVKRRWEYARSWLFRELQESDHG